MTTNKTVRDLRKLIDKTPIVDVTVIDKSPIPASRGMDDLNNIGFNRKDIETTYALIDIIDDNNGPKLREDNNLIDPFDHVAKITGMTDPDNSGLSIILKPNGVFD